jgi:hypothetical protein
VGFHIRYGVGSCLDDFYWQVADLLELYHVHLRSSGWFLYIHVLCSAVHLHSCVHRGRGFQKMICAQICRCVHARSLLKVAVSFQVSDVCSSFGYVFSCAELDIQVLLKQLFVHCLWFWCHFSVSFVFLK